MVFLKYKGSMSNGFVRGVGFVQRGSEYDVNESLATKLLANGEWEEMKYGLKKKTIKKDKVEYNEIESNLEVI